MGEHQLATQKQATPATNQGLFSSTYFPRTISVQFNSVNIIQYRKNKVNSEKINSVHQNEVQPST